MHRLCGAVFSNPPAVIARVEGLWFPPLAEALVYSGLRGEQLTAVELSGCLEVID